MTSIFLNKTTYSSGGELDIQLDFTNSHDLSDVVNINIDIFRVDIHRNNFAFGFGANSSTENTTINIKQKIPDTFQEGLYLVSGIKLIYGEDGHKVVPVKIENKKKQFFWFSNDETLSEEQLLAKISQMDSIRYQSVNVEIKTKTVMTGTPCKQYRVIVFAVGCLLHAPQLMEGYIIHPLGHGYQYDHMLEAVNKFVQNQYNFTINRVESIATSFSSSTPLFAVEFKNIKAANPQDAGNHCYQFGENIFTILAYDRGQKARSFATVIVDTSNGQISQAFHFPGYRGNLVSDFNPSSTANTIQRILPKIENSPWADLILRIYADAKSELNQNYACLKFWQILEMIAKKHVSQDNIEITNPSGSRIIDGGGNPVKTKYSLGKVYKYVFDKEIPSSINQSSDGGKIIFESFETAIDNPNCDENTRIISLWDTLCSLYEIRNATAHSGEFNMDSARNGRDREKKAVELLELKHNSFMSYIGSILMSVVSWEINNA